jgi:hypothetical protein
MKLFTYQKRFIYDSKFKIKQNKNETEMGRLTEQQLNANKVKYAYCKFSAPTESKPERAHGFVFNKKVDDVWVNEDTAYPAINGILVGLKSTETSFNNKPIFSTKIELFDPQEGEIIIAETSTNSLTGNKLLNRILGLRNRFDLSKETVELKFQRNTWKNSKNGSTNYDYNLYVNNELLLSKAENNFFNLKEVETFDSNGNKVVASKLVGTDGTEISTVKKDEEGNIITSTKNKNAREFGEVVNALGEKLAILKRELISKQFGTEMNTAVGMAEVEDKVCVDTTAMNTFPEDDDLPF